MGQTRTVIFDGNTARAFVPNVNLGIHIDEEAMSAGRTNYWSIQVGPFTIADSLTWGGTVNVARNIGVNEETVQAMMNTLLEG